VSANAEKAAAEPARPGPSPSTGAPSAVRGEANELVRALSDAWVIASKDLTVEIRSKEILLTMGYFGFLVVLIFAFAFFRGDAPISAVAAGILWVAIAFAGTLGLGRAFDREREGDCIRALLLSPVSRPAIYLGKTLGVFAFMLVIEAVVLPAVVFFFNLPLDLERTGWLLLIVLLGTIGYSVVGSLMAAMLLRARSKDVLLAIVLYPIILPILIAGVKATSTLLEAPVAWEELKVWLPALLFFDVVFLVASLWIFEPLVTD
jgi:heme exporter protein B